MLHAVWGSSREPKSFDLFFNFIYMMDTNIWLSSLSLGSADPPPLQRRREGSWGKIYWLDKGDVLGIFSFQGAPFKCWCEIWKEVTLCMVETEQDGFSHPKAVGPAQGLTGPVRKAHLVSQVTCTPRALFSAKGHMPQWQCHWRGIFHT